MLIQTKYWIRAHDLWLSLIAELLSLINSLITQLFTLAKLSLPQDFLSETSRLGWTIKGNS